MKQGLLLYLLFSSPIPIFSSELHQNKNEKENQIDRHRKLFLDFDSIRSFFTFTFSSPFIDSASKLGSRFRDGRAGSILSDLYLDTGGEFWTGGEGWTDPEIEPCDWEGVDCDDFMVTSLNMSGFGLTGTIPMEQIRKLYTLEILDLSDNFLTGTISSRMGRLLNLRILNLSNNDLSGEISSRLGRLNKLEELHLERNGQLNGGMPEEICELHDTWALENFTNYGFDVATEFCDIFLDSVGLSELVQDCSEIIELFPGTSDLEVISADCTIGNEDCTCCKDGFRSCCYDEDGMKQCTDSDASSLISSLIDQ